MQEELLQLKLQQVWILVDLLLGKRAIGTKWVYRNKKDERVTRIKAIRLFLAYASFKDFPVYQMDVKSAFLYNNMKRASKGYSRENIPLFPIMIIQGPVVQGEGSTHLVESHHTPTSAPSTSQPPISPTSRRTIRQESVVPQPRSPTQTHVADEATSIGVDVRYGGAATTITGLEARHGSVESLKIDLKQTKLTYGAAYTKLIKKVKKLENKVKSNQARRRAKIIVTDDEEDLEDPSKQGRKISEIDQDPTISLVQHNAEIQGRQEHDMEFEFDLDAAKDVNSTEEYISTAMPVSTTGATVTTASVDVSIAIVSTAKDKGIMEESEPVQTKTKLQQEQERLGYEATLRLQAEHEEEERVEADEELAQRLQAEEREKYSEAEKLRSYSFDEIKNLFITTMRRVHTFVPIDSEIEREIPESTTGSSKRDAEEELAQESSKRQKTGESSVSAEEPKDKEEELSQERLQQMMIIIPEQGMNVEALQTKYPIIDWEIYTEGARKYWKIIRVGNHTEVYQFFDDMLKAFDREDLVKLWSLVKEKFNSTEPT
ncbi:hypothetical protein Tco_1340758 [Tanacetum coccineum]